MLLTTVGGALIFGQKTVVYTDTKNNAASVAQKQIDEAMGKISRGTIPTAGTTTIDGFRVDLALAQVDKDSNGVKEGYDITVTVYYNNNAANVTMKAYAKTGGLGL
jgi:hypothetical protein